MAWYKQPVRPYDPVIEYDEPLRTVRYLRSEFNGSGQYSFPEPPNEPQDQWAALINVMPPIQGNFDRRWGYTSWASSLTSSEFFLRAGDYANEGANPVYKKSIWIGTEVVGGITYPLVAAYGDDGTFFTTIGANGGPAPVFPASSPSIHMAYSRSTAYFTDEIDSGLKWQGAATSSTSGWGIVAPPHALNIANGGAGSVTLVKGRTYFYVYRNSSTGHMSDLSAPSLSTGAQTNIQINLSSIAASTDPQVDKIWILATADGNDETLLYFLAEINNGTTTYTDNTPELTLLANNVVQETDVNGNLIGVADNAPPPAGKLVIKHQGRLFIAKGATLYCSKNLQELTTSTGLIAGKFEEAWPPENQFDISDDAEIITALVSDGVTLYIGTPRHIRRMNGDSPSDFQFQQVSFNEAGVVNEDAISVVYADGQPSGCVWVTPDLRVVHSDFNTYADIGGPVQDVLNNIPLTQLHLVRVTFFSRGAFELCAVQFAQGGVSSGNDTWLVFDMRNQTWVQWNLTAQTVASQFRFTQSGQPQWLFFDALHLFSIAQMAPTYIDDSGTAFTSTIQSVWWHFGMPADRKWLNEVEIITSDPNMTVSLDGATTALDFETPNNIVASAPLVLDPFGSYKVYFAGHGEHYRFYRIILSSTNSSIPESLLETINFEIIPIHKL